VDGKPKRRMTARWQYTNRLNARASTGPRTAGGKARVARNARQHGLSVPALSEPDLAPEVVELARRIAQSVTGQSLDEARHLLACRVAETLIDLRRVRLAKLPLLARVEADLENCAKPLQRLARLDRYEGRTLSRRKHAVRTFYEAVTGIPAPKPAWPIWRNKAMQQNPKDSKELSDDRHAQRRQARANDASGKTAEQSHARKGQ
jgi:hypothetical protein